MRAVAFERYQAHRHACRRGDAFAVKQQRVLFASDALLFRLPRVPQAIFAHTRVLAFALSSRRVAPFAPSADARKRCLASAIETADEIPCLQSRAFTLADASALEHEVRCFARLALRCQATRVGVKDPVCAWLLPRVAALAGLDNAGVFCTVAVTTFPRFFKHVSFATKKLLFALAFYKPRVSVAFDARCVLPRDSADTAFTKSFRRAAAVCRVQAAQSTRFHTRPPVRAVSWSSDGNLPGRNTLGSFLHATSMQ